MKPKVLHSIFSVTAILLLSLSTQAQSSKSASESPKASSVNTEAQATYKDIEKTLGFVPQFLKNFPESGVTGAWQEMKSIQLSPNTALSPKEKELIGLAVAAQIPCQYCAYFHTKAAKANGANDQEIKEAVAMASVVRHWSTWLNGMQINEKTFRSDVDRIFTQAPQKISTK